MIQLLSYLSRSVVKLACQMKKRGAHLFRLYCGELHLLPVATKASTHFVNFRLAVTTLMKISLFSGWEKVVLS